MTDAEVIAAAREITQRNQEEGDPTFDRRDHVVAVAAMLLSLHDGQQWTATPPSEPGDWWWRETMERMPIHRTVGKGPFGPLMCYDCLDLKDSWGPSAIMEVSKIGGFWLGPVTPADAAAVAELQAKLDYLRRCGITVGKLKDGHGERWSYEIAEGSELDDRQALHKLTEAELQVAELRRENERLKIVRCLVCDLATIMPGGVVYCDECYSELKVDRDRLAAELAAARAELERTRNERNQSLSELDNLQCEIASELGWDLKGKTFAESVRLIRDELERTRAALAEMVRLCQTCGGSGELVRQDDFDEDEISRSPCPVCKPARDLLGGAK